MISEPGWYIAAAAALFILGAYCISVKRNMIKIVIGLEVLTSAVHLNFITLGYAISPTHLMDPLAQSIVIISIVLGACVATIALLLVIYAHRHYQTLDVKRLRKLRW
jgi:multicomponent Na+:H+ antiporter subunit C